MQVRVLFRAKFYKNFARERKPNGWLSSGREVKRRCFEKTAVNRPVGESCSEHLISQKGSQRQLDVAYREDGCKICKAHGAENFSVIRRATLNILKGEKKTKAGIKNKRSKAGWDRRYMLELLGVN